MKKASLFYPEMDYQEEEAPILYYDDTLTKNGKDSMLLTDRRLYVANLGQVASVDLMDIERFTPVEKLLGPHILVNDRYKISVGIAGKKYVQDFIDLIRMAVMTGIAIRPLRDMPDEGELQSIMEELHRIGELSDGGKLRKQELNKQSAVLTEEKSFENPQIKQHCVKCGNEINIGAKFCSICGTPVGEMVQTERRCPKCGNLIKPGKRFCNQCGTKIE